MFSQMNRKKNMSTDTSWPESQLTNDKWVGFGQLFMAIRTLVTCMVEIKSSW